MKKQIILDVDKCVGCGACVVACMDQHDRMFDHPEGEAPNRRIIAAEIGSYPDASIRYASVACMHCADPACVMGCPTGALYKDPETGAVLANKALCIGCHSCAMACPYGVPTFGPDGKMRKCDACMERQKAGLVPACVKVCPTGALMLLTEDELKAWQTKEQQKKAEKMVAGQL